MSDVVRQAVLKNNTPKKFPQFSSGDTISVSVKVKEGEKERIQLFKGVVLKIQGSGTSRTFTVRKISEGIGVERTFPFMSPIVDSVEVQAYGKTRRSRLFYLRGLKGRAAKVKSELAVMREQREKAKAQAAEKK
ncbi:MAG: 50S ribosomal protein L19 [Pseudomonadota bacterium]